MRSLPLDGPLDRGWRQGISEGQGPGFARGFSVQACCAVEMRKSGSRSITAEEGAGDLPDPTHAAFANEGSEVEMAEFKRGLMTTLLQGGAKLVLDFWKRDFYSF